MPCSKASSPSMSYWSSCCSHLPNTRNRDKCGLVEPRWAETGNDYCAWVDCFFDTWGQSSVLARIQAKNTGQEYSTATACMSPLVSIIKQKFVLGCYNNSKTMPGGGVTRWMPTVMCSISLILYHERFFLCEMQDFRMACPHEVHSKPWS